MELPLHDSLVELGIFGSGLKRFHAFVLQQVPDRNPGPLEAAEELEKRKKTRMIKQIELQHCHDSADAFERLSSTLSLKYL